MTDFLFQEDRKKQRRSEMFGTAEFRQAYRNHINSAAWKKLSKLVRRRANHHCERCGCVSIRLEVHHRCYERFQNESLSDLQALCPSCHILRDQERRARNKRRFKQAGEEARYNAAMNTYLTKKYGEDWYCGNDCEELEEEFEEWLESKNGEDEDF